MFSKLFKFIAGSRLRNKFTLVFIIFSTFPVLVLGSVTLYLMDLSHKHDVSSLELQLINQKIEEIEKFFADTLGILELRVGFSQKSEIELSQQNFLLEGLLEENRAFKEVSFIGLNGKETAKKSRIAEDAELTDVSKLPKFQTAFSEQNYIGPIYYTLSGPFVTLTAPVRNRNGEMIQLLSAEVNLLQITRSLESELLGFSGYLALTDKNGLLIAYKSAHDGNGISVGADLSASARVKSVLGGKDFDALGDKDRYESVLSKVAVVGAAKIIPQLGWAIFAEWPLDDADTIIQDVRNQVSTFTLISIFAVLMLAPFFALRLLRPIHELEAGASEIEQGNFEKRVEIQTQDELEDLGAAFNKMAQGLKRLQELKNEFVFIAAHELRAPVTAIKGYLSMVLDAGLPDRFKEYINPVIQSNERLINLVNDVLEIARSEAGRMKIEVVPTDIRPLVASTILELKPLAVEKKISISYEEPEDGATALADQARFKEVIANLISNAVKYNNEGGRIKIYHEFSSDSITTHVEDNGIGMSDEDQKHVFEKFFRAETGKTQTIVGTGLGLFITKELVEKMGGKIWFRSKFGEGTRFSFSLIVGK